MQGTVLKVAVQDGDAVDSGQLLCVIEAMKMENEIVAPREGLVRDLTVAPGDAVTSGQLICAVAARDPAAAVMSDAPGRSTSSSTASSGRRR